MMMTLLIVLGIVVFFIGYFSVGQVLAIKLSPRVAALCTKQEYTATHYLWRNVDGDEDDMWLLPNWYVVKTINAGKKSEKKEKNDRWYNTKETKGNYSTKFSEEEYRDKLFYLRTWWIFYLPYLLNYMADTKAIQQYDPEHDRIRKEILKQEIAELEAQKEEYEKSGKVL